MHQVAFPNTLHVYTSFLRPYYSWDTLEPVELIAPVKMLFCYLTFQSQPMRYFRWKLGIRAVVGLFQEFAEHYIDNIGGSGTEFSNRYKNSVALPATFSIYEIFVFFIEPQINLQNQETYRNPI